MTQSSTAGDDLATSMDSTNTRKTHGEFHGPLLGAARLEVVVGVVVFALVSLTLHVPTFIGMADSHDFNRVMGPVGIHYPPLSDSVLYFHWINRFYQLGAPYTTAGTYPSSTILVLALAGQISRLFYGNTFDLALVGWIYTLLFAFGAYLIVRGLRTFIPSRAVVVAICIVGGFLFLDVAYTAYFNSLYSEPTEYVFIFLGLGAALNLLASQRPSYVMLVILAVSIFVFATNKLQDFPLAVLVAVVILWLVRLRPSRAWRTTIISAALVTLVCGALVYVAVPQTYHQAATYNAVFDGILVDAPPSESRTILVEAGTDPTYASLVGQNYYSNQSLRIVQTPAFLATFFDRVSAVTLVRIYLSHPGVLVAGLERSATAAAVMRPDNLGNFTPDAGEPATAQANRFALWSGFKTRVSAPLWLLAMGFLLYFAGIIWEYTRAADCRTRRLVALYALVGSIALIAFPIPWAFAGDFELVKHLFTFEVLGDLTLAIAGSWIILRAARALSRFIPVRRPSPN